MRFARSTAAAALAASLPLAQAQTSTTCDPTKGSCPADTGLNSATFNTDFTQGSGANSSWSSAAYTTINYGSKGAEFTIQNANQAPTISSDFYIFFGRVEVKMMAAPGTGIVSSIVLESDDLDEIDWEFLGGNTAQCETNFFGKGNTTAYDRAIYYNVASPQTTFHTYTVDWTAERLEYIIDGTTVRTLAFDDPLTNGGTNYPQTPMRIKLGNWAGGGPGEPEGTVEWAGGATDFSQAPFTMYVSSVSITNYNPADSYEYGDQTGSWQSIKVISGGNSASASGGPSSATGSASTSASASSASSTSAHSSTSAATTAPTSSIEVAPLNNTQVVAPTTVTGSAYSTNSASVSAQNTGAATQPAVSGPSSVQSSATSQRASGTTSSSTSTPSTNAAATLNGILTAASLLSVAVCFWML